MDLPVRIQPFKPVHQIDFGTDGPLAARQGIAYRSDDRLGGAVLIGPANHLVPALGADDDPHLGVALPPGGDMGGGELHVHRAVAVPENYLGLLQLSRGIAAQRFTAPPEDHFVVRDTKGAGGIAAQMLVWEKENFV